MWTPATTWMDLEDIVLSDTRQSQKGQILDSSTHKKYLKQ